MQVTDLDYVIPDGFPAEAKDLVDKLLLENPDERLGAPEKGVAGIAYRGSLASAGCLSAARMASKGRRRAVILLFGSWKVVLENI